MMNDENIMSLAIEQAKIAACMGEIPVGAVITNDSGDIISVGYNRVIAENDPTLHAEIVAIKNASRELSSYRLTNLNIYVTLEPCFMCIGALFHARIKRIFFGAYDYKTGACGSIVDAITFNKLNHHVNNIKGGILESECSFMLTAFFRELRRKKSNI